MYTTSRLRGGPSHALTILTRGRPLRLESELERKRGLRVGVAEAAEESAVPEEAEPRQGTG